MANKYSKRQDQKELDEGVEKYQKTKKEKEEREDKPAPRNHIVKYIASLKDRNLPQDVIDQASKQPSKNAAQRVVKKYRIQQAGL